MNSKAQGFYSLPMESTVRAFHRPQDGYPEWRAEIAGEYLSKIELAEDELTVQFRRLEMPGESLKDIDEQVDDIVDDILSIKEKYGAFGPFSRAKEINSRIGHFEELVAEIHDRMGPYKTYTTYDDGSTSSCFDKACIIPSASAKRDSIACLAENVQFSAPSKRQRVV